MSYSPEWFTGKTGDEVKNELSKRHSIPMWRVEEILEVWDKHKDEKEMNNLIS